MSIKRNSSFLRHRQVFINLLYQIRPSGDVLRIALTLGFIAAVIAGWVVIRAPGFTLRGHKFVDLKYGDALQVKGDYRSLWKLALSTVEVSAVSPEEHIPIDFPLKAKIGGNTYGVGEFTPQLVRRLGGNVIDHKPMRGISLPRLDQPPGDSFGGLAITQGAAYPRAMIGCWFREGKPVVWTLTSSRNAASPVRVNLTYKGGPTLPLPATESDVRRAFGPPTERVERIVVPDRNMQPLSASFARRSPSDQRVTLTSQSHEFPRRRSGNTILMQSRPPCGRQQDKSQTCGVSYEHGRSDVLSGIPLFTP